MATNSPFRIDGYPPVMLAKNGRQSFVVRHERTGTFQIYLNYRHESRATVVGWGFDVTKVRKWSWTVCFTDDRSCATQYMNSFHETEDRDSCLEIATEIAVKWIHASDRIAMWREYLVEESGEEYAKSVMSAVERLDRLFPEREVR